MFVEHRLASDFHMLRSRSDHFALANASLYERQPHSVVTMVACVSLLVGHDYAFIPEGFNVPFRSARRFMMKKITGVIIRT